MDNTTHPLLHWIPNKLIEKDNALYFEWIYLGEEKFEDSFFEETIQKSKKHPFNSNFYKLASSVETLIDWSNQIVSLELKSLIFHVSRCGSTMLCQSLVTSPQNVVISEAPIIDAVLRSESLNLKEKNSVLKAIVRLLGQKRFPDQKYLIIKLDAWNIFQAHQLRILYPELPFMLLYRKPLEVLESHAKLRGMHMVPNLLPATIFGIAQNKIQNVSFQNYGVLVLEKYLQAFIDFSLTDVNTSIYNYKQGIKFILNDFISVMKVNYPMEVIELMNQRLKRHSKHPSLIFEGDSKINLDLDIDLTKVNHLYEKLNGL